MYNICNGAHGARKITEQKVDKKHNEGCEKNKRKKWEKFKLQLFF